MLQLNHSEDRPFSVFERPGSAEVLRLAESTNRTIEAIDSPADFIADALHQQLDGYSGPIPQSHAGLRNFVISQFRNAAGPTAVSAMLEGYIEREEIVHIATAIKRMLITIRNQSRPALACDAISIAMGFHIGEGKSIEQVAKKHGVTKQALSKRAIRLCTELGLDPSVLMRSIESRESYRIKQKGRHAAARHAGLGDRPVEEMRAALLATRQHVNAKQLRQQREKLCA